MAVAQNLLINPASTGQRYIAWSTGYIEALGSALPVAHAESVFGSGSVAPNAPTFFAGGGDPVAAVQIISYAAPSGYTLDIFGTVYDWGGATAPASQPPNVFLFQPVFGFYSDFAMNPAGNGQGYVLNYDGDVLAFGGATALGVHSAFLAGTGVQALRLYMEYTSKRYWVLDSMGRWWGKNGGNNLAVGALPPLGTLGSDQIQFAGALYDKSAAAKGWHLNQFGLVSPIGGAQAAPGSPYNPNSRIWQDIAIIDDGTGANPLRLALLNQFGGVFEYLVSTAPTVAVTKPDDPTTTTTRPIVGWTYTDLEGDAQALWEAGVFTAAQYGIGGFDPAVSPATFRTSGTDAQARTVQVPQDLANATYRAYVRVTDTSGLVSSWQNKQWVQNVTRPVTPTVTPSLTGTIQSVSLLLHVSALTGSGKLGVQYLDADDTVWRWVKNGWDLVPNGSGDATVIDYGAGFGVQRTYRAIYYVYDSATDTWNGSDWSSTANATLTQRKWVLSTADDSDLLEVSVTPDFSAMKMIKAGIFWAAGRADPIIVRDGVPKSPQLPLSVYSLTAATRAALELILPKETVLLRDPFGHRYYGMFVDSQTQQPLRAKSIVGETTPLRDANVYQTTVQVVSRPKTGPLVGPLAA